MSEKGQAEYVLGTNDAELARLGLQHRLWSAAAHDLWERAGFKPGQSILDAGCGPGYASIDLARMIGPAGQIIAIDESERFVAALRSRAEFERIHWIDARVGDVQRLDLPPDSIDGVYSRWVLCFVPQPEAAVRSIARALRPGGVFALQDYFSYESLTLAPRSRIMARVVEAVGAAWRARGGDPDFVGRLPRMMMEAGLEVRDIRPIQRVARPGSLLWQWPTTFFGIFAPTLVPQYLSAAELNEFKAEWARYSEDSAAFFLTPTVFDVIGVKRS